MRKLLLLLLTLSFAAVSPSLAINFSRVNLAWQYDVNFPVSMKHRVVSSENENTIFLRLKGDSLQLWNFEFLIQDGYESEQHDVAKVIAIDTLSKEGGMVFVQVTLAKSNESLLVLKFNKPEQFYYYDINLKIGSFSYPAIYPIDDQGLPILDAYINRSDTFWKGCAACLANEYPEVFSMADPPMADMKPLAPQVKEDSSFVFQGSYDWKENYFYAVRGDSLAPIAATVLRMPPYFPDSRTLQELVEPMLYITSEPEKKSIMNAKNLKLNFDSFWMNTYGTKTRARGAIRKYYAKVRTANSLYTDFKPGWKTDRGMMHIVFGKPHEVYRTGNKEEWYYDSGEAFEFIVISSFFAPRTYTLRRSKDFEELWFNQLTSIRRGI